MRLVRPWAPFIPEEYLRRIPVVGRVGISLPNGHRVRLKTDGYDYVTSSLYWNGLGGYEPGTIRLFLRLLSRADVFIDIGANTGLYALIAAAENSCRQVYAFEPVPRIFQALERNIRLNGFRNCQPHCLAVGDYDGEVRLFIPPGMIPSGATTNSMSPPHKSPPVAIPVAQVKLDTFISTRGIDKVDLIKIDTETTEPRVLQGAISTLEKCRPFIICEVLPGKSGEDLQCIMKSYNYAYYWISGDLLMPRASIIGDGVDMNYLFAPKERLLESIAAGVRVA